MPVIQLVAPTAEPISVAEAIAWAQIAVGDQMPAPVAPTVALGTGAGNVDNGAHRYLVRFITATGGTQGGAVSAAVTVADKTVNGKVAVSAIPLGDATVTARELYRTAAGGLTYMLLATIADNSTTTYADNIADASLGAGAPVTNTAEDPLLRMLVIAAREDAEHICRRAFVTQQWKAVFDQFPMPGMNISSANWYGPQWGNTPGPLSVTRPDGKTGFEIYLPYPPLQTVDSIKYIDVDGVQQTLSPSQYIVDPISEPGRITPAFNTSWPSTRNQINAVEVTFTCGYGAAAAVPQKIKQWIALRVATLFANREEVAILARGKVEALPFVDGLLDKYRCLEY
ncbi:MAG: hypothetical protein JWQ10_3807 [Herbaspirillum sp.]|nr:hypothetical protein [Herbaspirillum sp.]